MCRYFKRVGSVGTRNYIYFWEIEGLSDKNITVATTSDYSPNRQFSYLGTKRRLEFKENCLKQDKATMIMEK